MIRFQENRQAARWLADWPSRANVQPWMLFNLCLALRHLGRYGQANAVARHVVEVWGHREGAADMRLFLAVEDALTGSIPSALLHLQLAVVRDQVDYDQQLLALAKALIDFRQTPAAERPTKLSAIQRSLQARFPFVGLLRADKDVRRTFRRVGKAIVHLGGGGPARLWFGWRLHWAWLLFLAAPAIVVAGATNPSSFVPTALAIVLISVWISRRK
jgi:hypothetical protein